MDQLVSHAQVCLGSAMACFSSSLLESILNLFSHHHQEHGFLVVAAARIAGAPAPAPAEAEAEAGAGAEPSAVTGNAPRKGGFEFLQTAK